jgi:hypothetical protein
MSQQLSLSLPICVGSVLVCMELYLIFSSMCKSRWKGVYFNQSHNKSEYLHRIDSHPVIACFLPVIPIIRKLFGDSSVTVRV